MIRPAHAAFLLSLVVPRSSAEAGGGLIPPLEVELGAAAISAPRGGSIAATQLLVGMSWASLYPHPTPVDVSFGMIATFASEHVASRSAPGTAARLVGEATRPSADASGAFVATDARVSSGRHWRTWVGGRGELMAAGGVGVLGAAARVSAELWAPVQSGQRGGGIFGTVALTGWAEIGMRERPDRSIATIVAAGIGIRLPLVAVAH